MGFRITGLSPEPFRHLYGLSDQELVLHGVKRYIADKQPGFPDRIEMRDALRNSCFSITFASQPIHRIGLLTQYLSEKAPRMSTTE